ncbi:MAG: hypothetical protein ACRD3F_07510 [Acidobacteriaceae bacterium]
MGIANHLKEKGILMQRDNHEYPTEQEIEESFAAYQKGGTALLDFLREQTQKREQEKPENPST